MSRPSRPPAPEPVRLLSPARLAANRSNAQRSTGPRTIAGKAASAQNAITHGLLSQQPVLPGEDPALLDAFTERLQREFAPETAVEELLLDDIASLFWRLQRAARVEVGLYTVGLQAPALRALTGAGEASSALGLAFAGQASSFGTLSRYETALVHRLRRALQELERLKAASAPSCPALFAIAGARARGFVSQSELPSEDGRDVVAGAPATLQSTAQKGPITGTYRTYGAIHEQ